MPLYYLSRMTRRSPTVGLMLTHRLHYRLNNKPTLSQRLVYLHNVEYNICNSPEWYSFDESCKYIGCITLICEIIL